MANASPDFPPDGTADLDKLRRPPAIRSRRPPSAANDRLSLLEYRCQEVTNEFRKLSNPKAPDVDRLRLASILRKTLTLLGRLEMELGIY